VSRQSAPATPARFSPCERSGERGSRPGLFHLSQPGAAQSIPSATRPQSSFAAMRFSKLFPCRKTNAIPAGTAHPISEAIRQCCEQTAETGSSSFLSSPSFLCLFHLALCLSVYDPAQKLAILVLSSQEKSMRYLCSLIRETHTKYLQWQRCCSILFLQTFITWERKQIQQRSTQ